MTLSEWKALPVTQVILAELSARVNLIKDELADSAGLDPLEDAKRRGIILGYKDILDVQLDEEAHGD